MVLGLALLPALGTGLIRQIAALLHDPDGHAHTIAFAFANLFVAMVFFALIYLELGIYSPSEPGGDVTSFTTCLYFSASILTTTGLGEFVPRPETRFIAALQMIFGYLAFGILTSATFFLLLHRSQKAQPAARPLD
ncbi:MAG: hypothetical protein AVDCRST_MAG89-2118 [uncultured Gemmatimonadetes bacterium]|uniref:Potassium channel domain-containing protein n=1 Tax=uncultured Gemmatimonadota bacterium TaxID=203437 RepID=A0A6J4LFM1_9BACT|nr:MAG: hypothetical protein AVDCRST_MAG89-2118 [uncultured Gemmatimonadota bacterium]